MTRNIHSYTEQYMRLPFEPLQAAYRRRKVLAEIERHRPRRLLEIGCGHQPLFIDWPAASWTVIEPAPLFAENARTLASGYRDVHVVEGYAEVFSRDPEDAPYDMVILSCLLHEVEDPQSLLSSVRRLCSEGTLLHVNVPNARSLHRLLAVAMGLISSPESKSDMQRTMQQRSVYDAVSLHDELVRAGFAVAEHGTLFVKPFTHAQMQQLVDEGFLTPALLEGLDRLVQQLPDLGSELWVNARLANA